MLAVFVVCVTFKTSLPSQMVALWRPSSGSPKCTSPLSSLNLMRLFQVELEAMPGIRGCSEGKVGNSRRVKKKLLKRHALKISCALILSSFDGWTFNSMFPANYIYGIGRCMPIPDFGPESLSLY